MGFSLTYKEYTSLLTMYNEVRTHPVGVSLSYIEYTGLLTMYNEVRNHPVASVSAIRSTQACSPCTMR